eukprot:GHVN01028399.1.p1 GENE.GHVN01028399.1~~GHVN01028399.1.p1  ORF type:complete len:241 (-),score=72.15 GHVN01028399.1:752-1474(-)
MMSANHPQEVIGEVVSDISHMFDVSDVSDTNDSNVSDSDVAYLTHLTHHVNASELSNGSTGSSLNGDVEVSEGIEEGIEVEGIVAAAFDTLSLNVDTGNLTRSHAVCPSRATSPSQMLAERIVSMSEVCEKWDKPLERVGELGGEVCEESETVPSGGNGVSGNISEGHNSLINGVDQEAPQGENVEERETLSDITSETTFTSFSPFTSVTSFQSQLLYLIRIIHLIHIIHLVRVFTHSPR